MEPLKVESVKPGEDGRLAIVRALIYCWRASHVSFCAVTGRTAQGHQCVDQKHSAQQYYFFRGTYEPIFLKQNLPCRFALKEKYAISQI